MDNVTVILHRDQAEALLLLCRDRVGLTRSYQSISAALDRADTPDIEKWERISQLESALIDIAGDGAGRAREIAAAVVAECWTR